MAKEKLIRRAKVTLTKGKTYSLAGRKYIRNVPVIVRGSLCDEFKNNGYFTCTELDPKPAKKKKNKSSDEEVSAPVKKKLKSKGKKSKSSSKKKAKR